MRVCERPGCDRVLPEDAPENRAYCSSRCRTAHWRLKRETPKRVKPSGRQVSYNKAYAAAIDAIVYARAHRGAEATTVAQIYMQAALPERQR